MRRFFGLLAGALALGILYQAGAARLDRRRFRLPGRWLATERGVFYLQEQGQGSPTVLLESGLAASSLSWTLVQPVLASVTRTCSYDRAGFGWSPPAVRSRTAAQVTADLLAVVQNASLAYPCILVGHSYGGLLARRFAALYPDQIAGLILVDPVSLRYWSQCGPADTKRLRTGARLARRGALLARVGLVRLALLLLSQGHTRLPKLIARGSSGQANRLILRLTEEIRKLPVQVLPWLRAHWSRPSAFQTMAAYLDKLVESACEVGSMTVPAHIPVTILSAANATEQELVEREEWVHQSQQGRHIRLETGGHWIPLEHPQEVVAAIGDMVSAVRNNLRSS